MIHKYSVLESTNKYAMENIDSFDNFDVIVCENQTLGYGVTGMWDGYIGNLFYTIVLDSDVIESRKLPFIILNSMYNVINTYIDDVYIKLPNDLYVNDKKIGGFIIESKNNKYIVGIGMNINSSVDNHIALRDIINYDINLDRIIESLTKCIIHEIDVDEDEIIKSFNENTKIVGEFIRYQDKLTGIKYEDNCLAIDFDYIYFQNSTISIEKFSKLWYIEII